ncbi:MAG: UTRA domain-containing protein, partial [Clostridia bacterium]|nr:UTRA domain-containing protein [Clostridia bacterium]
KASHDVSLIAADENKAGLLGIEVGSPLLFLHEVIYDQKGRPLHISHQYIRGDRFTLKL